MTAITNELLFRSFLAACVIGLVVEAMRCGLSNHASFNGSFEFFANVRLESMHLSLA